MDSQASSEDLLGPRIGAGAGPSHRLGRCVARAARIVAALAVATTTGVGVTLALPASAGAVTPNSETQATAPSWAGYIGIGSYRAVSTTLVVPAATCAPGENSSASFWAGIGGLESATIEQTGVESACQAGHPAYWAWWEAYGGSPSSGPLSEVRVHPADTVTATVFDRGGGTYAMTVTDATSRTMQSATATVAGAVDSSIECIAEDPRGTGGQVPYTDYGTVTFSSCLAGGVESSSGTVVSDGFPVGIGTLVRITGVTGGNGVNAAVSPISDGTSFTVTREFPPVYTPPLDRPVIGMAGMPDGSGYWLVNGAGAVSAHGAAQLHGSMAGHRLDSPVVSIVSTPSGLGYWLVASDGGVFSFGDATFSGSMGGQHLTDPVVSLAPGPDGHAYWLVASDGGVFAFGTPYYGSMGGQYLAKPVLGIDVDSATGGYWLVASDGGVFAFNASFLGSTGATPPGSPIHSFDATTSGHGYWLVSSDGGVYSFGDAVNYGGVPGVSAATPMIGVAVDAAT
ncbi:MAG TPA: G1 family glutamic endopeptidase, partial [Acidimicrobiales bacterium]